MSSLTPCNYGAGCRMMVPTHANHISHMQRLYHPAPNASIAAEIQRARVASGYPSVQPAAAAPVGAARHPYGSYQPQPQPNQQQQYGHQVAAPSYPQQSYAPYSGHDGYVNGGAPSTVPSYQSYHTAPATGGQHALVMMSPTPSRDPYAIPMAISPPAITLIGTLGRPRCRWGITCGTSQSDHGHAMSHCHAQECPVPYPCQLVNSDDKHRSRFYHAAPPVTAAPVVTPNISSPHHHHHHHHSEQHQSPSTSSPWNPQPAQTYSQQQQQQSYGESVPLYRPSMTGPPVKCPVAEDCQLVASDPDHRQGYWHYCRNIPCDGMTNGPHLRAYRHWCPQEGTKVGCRMRSDPDHNTLYEHRASADPFSSAKPTTTTTPGRAGSGTPQLLPSVQESKYDGSGRLLEGTHPHHKVPTDRFSHLSSANSQDIEVLPPCPNNEADGGCVILRTDPTNEHCFNYSHHCPDGSSCAHQSARTHHSRFLHPCSNGLSCPEFLSGQRAHNGFYSHFIARLPYCVTPHLDDCKINHKNHQINFRHICAFGSKCPDMNKPEHASRFVHPCIHADKCDHLKAPQKTTTIRTGSANRIRELHLCTYSHPCPTQDCKNTDSPHCYDFMHAVTFVPPSLKYPEYWDAKAQTRRIQYLPVINGTAEWNSVEGEFKKTMPVAKVHSIERYQHPEAWMQYCERREYVTKKNGKTATEMKLFHGTKNNILNYVLGGRGVPYQGFDYRMSRMGSVGAGIYTARDAHYSDNGYVDAPDTQGLLHMLLCWVITGESTPGLPNMLEPPDQLPPAPPGTPYDSVTNGAPPIMWIVHDGRRIYPIYVIHYTRT